MARSSTQSSRALAKVSAMALLAASAAVSCGSDEDEGAGGAGSPASGGTSGSAGTGGTIIGAGTSGISTGQSDSALPDPCRGGIELPFDSYHVAPGLCVRAVAIMQGQLRQISFTSNGTGITCSGVPLSSVT